MTKQRKRVQIKMKSTTHEYQKALNTRLVWFMSIFAVIFTIILYQLFTIQVLSSEEYTKKLTSFTQTLQYLASPRGEMHDRFGEVLVTNRERLAIVYFPPQDMSSNMEWELAYRFSDSFDINVSHLNTRDLKDVFLVNFAELANSFITDEEWSAYREREINDQSIYLKKLERITDTHLGMLNDRMIEAYVVKQAMNQTPRFSLKIIKDDASLEEVALLIESIRDFPGFDVNIFFDRTYPYDSMLRGLFGGVTSTQQGLVSEKLNYYLAMGYARNASVGRSGLELQYETLLKGQDTAYEVLYNEDGLAYFTEASMGSKGQDLQLSVDIELQREIENILTETFKEHANNPYRTYMDTIYVVASDPSTGDVLGLAGMKKEGESIYNNPVATYTEALAMGSSIKGASLYLGYNEGVIRFNETILDEPIKIANTPLKRSFVNLGLVNDLVALSRSSNVYMFHIAMRVGGARYVYNSPLNINLSAFDTIRNTFSQFGLGTLTGIDVPNESVGFIGNSNLGGHLLDFVIGQFDTYTPLQLSQYINTIANDGIRVKPRLVLQSTMPNSGQIAYQNPVTVLSVLENQAGIERIQDGFRLCVTDGYCQAHLKNQSIEIAAKTGTAESFMFDEEGNYFDSPNSVLVSYAPFKNPRISLACAIPHSWNGRNQANLCLEISGKIYQWYFENR